MMNLRRTIISAIKKNNYLGLQLHKYTTECLESEKNEPANIRSSKLLYNSYLEIKANSTSYQRRKFLEQRQKKNIQKQLIYPDVAFKAASEQSLSVKHGDEKEIAAQKDFPTQWMDDYEFYEGSIDGNGNINLTHGTADATISPSKVPCSGCGAHLQCASPAVPGYIPTEIFKGRSKRELQTIICQRCHFLKHYNIALDIEVSAESYIDTISKIKNEFALAVVIVDLLDFPCSIWPDMQELLGRKRPVFVVGNKVDLLPRDSAGYLERVKSCLKQQMVKNGFEALNIKYVSLISAKTGYGIEQLITQLHKIWKHNGDVYLLGCTNVGKSTLFNILLNSDYCRPEATDLVRKATVCPWPGTTLQMLKFPILRPSEIRVYHRFRRLFSERAQHAAEEKLRRDQAQRTGSRKSAKLIGKVGRTFDTHEDSMDAFAMSRGTEPIVALDEKKIEFQKSKWCFDTPGVLHPDQITNLLTTEELLMLEPEDMISPRGFRIKPGMSVFLSGLARVDFIDYKGSYEVDWIKMLVFSSVKQPVSMTLTEDADDFYRENLGTKLLGLPCGSAERLASWPGLQCKSELMEVVGPKEEENSLSCDILLSSIGWIGFCLPSDSRASFRAWTPHARGIYVRSPALVPYAERLVGKKIRKSWAYNMARPFTFKK